MAITREGIEDIYGKRFIDGNSVELLTRGESVFERLFSALREARTSICLQFYIYRDDETGRALADILKARAKQGVSVYLLYDQIGSWHTHGAFWDELRADGIDARPSRPFRWASAWLYMRRDHRKLVVIDGRTAATGGFNIGNEYCSPGALKREIWRDTGIFIHGPASLDMRATFRTAWRKSGGGEIPIGEPGNVIHTEPGALPVLPVFAHTVKGRRGMRKVLYYGIREAERDIWLTTAYFTPSLIMMHELELAVRRGVRVRLLVPGLSDVPAAHYAGRSFFTHLLKIGVEIYEYQGTMLHAKSYVFDGAWSVVGSANLDFRSLRWNDEGNVGIYGESFASEMRRIFEDDLRHSHRLELEAWKRRPVFERIKEAFYTMFRRNL